MARLWLDGRGRQPVGRGQPLLGPLKPPAVLWLCEPVLCRCGVTGKASLGAGVCFQSVNKAETGTPMSLEEKNIYIYAFCLHACDYQSGRGSTQEPPTPWVKPQKHDQNPALEKFE